MIIQRNMIKSYSSGDINLKIFQLRSQRVWILRGTIKVLQILKCCCNVLLAPVDSPLDGLHLAEHGQQQGGFPTTHLAHDHSQLT